MKLMFLSLALMLCVAAPLRAAPLTLTDLAGRQVTLNAPAQRIVLGDSRLLLALSLLHPDDPLRGIVAWDDSLRRRAPDMARRYAQAYPRLTRIPVFANPYRSDLSVEFLLPLRPDLAIFDLGLLPRLRESGTLALLEKSGVAALFIDFRRRPLHNTVPSLRLLGQALGEPANAERFIARYQQLLQRVQRRVAAIPDAERPGVVFENHAGMTGDTCCTVFGRSGFGQFIEAAGGRNLLADRVPDGGGDVNLEQLIAARPARYLLSGADWSQRGGLSLAVPLGYQATEASARPRLRRLLTRRGFATLPAIRDGQVMAIYHQFYDSPFNVIALEAIAAFLHPARFGDVDPHADLQTLYRQFAGMEEHGLFFLRADTTP
ncbi:MULTISPECIES: ABC transporter substrate-binding protein [Edwardsiella]|uniref:ABC transporter substrate-binding protein n=2 Tax=Edwardsiella anguillarum TaxID=1821960 RepID=A0ABY8S953_9GAMM|nr:MULTISPECIES: ABC transporter substrate-binding protein [Edwardsiella]AIJ10437.1 Putative periplasmic substrate-binding transport protein [Edwardsiella anguillarum ET080813]AKR77936.2 ABC transporter substrate-binding protein [Edwardsiella sp. LADL05-105]KAB0589614.1 ABC transporter substrate-binding protein [Edwardsiella anguillarum]RFT01821.1 iron transporter [Edwardsiella anguillarum]UOU77639.1 ABC transporter substrate-binding protein [Edwardsiella anguillarum]